MKSPLASRIVSRKFSSAPHGSEKIILQLSPWKREIKSRFSALPELSRTMTSISGPPQEQACAILEIAERPSRRVGIRTDSRTKSLRHLSYDRRPGENYSGMQSLVTISFSDSHYKTTPRGNRPFRPQPLSASVARLFLPEATFSRARLAFTSAERACRIQYREGRRGADPGSSSLRHGDNSRASP